MIDFAALPGSIYDIYLPRNNFVEGSNDQSEFWASRQPNSYNSGYTDGEYNFFSLFYRSNGGDYCNMKKVRYELSKITGNKVVLFRK